MIDLNVITQAIDEVAMRYISGALTKAMELNLDVITLFVFMFQNKTTEDRKLRLWKGRAKNEKKADS